MYTDSPTPSRPDTLPIWRVDDLLIRLAGLHGRLHRVVHLEDEPLVSVLPERRLILPLHDGERLHDVVDVVPLDSVRVEEAGIELRSQERAARNQPPERRRSEEHTSELQSLMRNSYAVF